MPASASIQYFATSPAWKLVPQATMVTALADCQHRLGVGPKASGSTWSAPRRPSRVSAMARGCSKISFCMKCRYSPRSAESAATEDSRTGRSTGCPSAVPDGDAVAAQLGEVALLQKDEAIGDRQQGKDVRADEVLLEADADDQGAALARGDQPSRVVGVDDAEGVGPVEPARAAHGLGQRMARGELIVDGVHDDLGVGLRGEAWPAAILLGAQLLVVLDNAVVHDGAALAGEVRMGVLGGGLAVGRPAGVGNAEEPSMRVRLRASASFETLPRVRSR
jgi:hypothetical protein